MKNLNITVVLLGVILYSCNSTSNSNSDNLTNLNGVNIDSRIIDDISKKTNKSFEKNTVTRYRSSDSTARIFEPYDSVVSGIKFKFVEEQTAYNIIDKHFGNVKKTNNYLFLTNLDFDDSYNSYYDIIIAPVSDQFELIKFVGTEPVNYDLSTNDVIEWFKKQQKEFDFDIIVADLDRIEAIIRTEPKSYKKLGDDIYKFCPDVIDQGHSDMDELIEFLKSNKRMWFWWD